MIAKIEKSWSSRLQQEFSKSYFKTLNEYIVNEYESQTIFPSKEDIFNAFEYCPFDQVRVIILGQDPYHGIGQAHGLSFSVPSGVKIPPSLRNIFKEINNNLRGGISENGNLEKWARQGVLLLNATLTVRKEAAGSHQKKGWETFTDAVIELLSKEKEAIVFLLWGSYAQKKEQLIDTQKHLILKSAHPSPLSAYRGFFGNRHFSQTNEYLIEKGHVPIDWL